MLRHIGKATSDWLEKAGLLAACIAVTAAMITGFALAAVPATAATAPTVVSLTFDNGWENQMTAAADMQAAGLAGTFYVPSGWIGLANEVSMSDLQTLKADGDEIGGKTVDNADLTALTQSGTASGIAEAQREVCEGRNILLADGFDVTDFAYPFADFNAADETIAENCGFNSGRGVGSLADAQPNGCTFPDCPYAETIPPTDPFSIRTPDDAEVTTTVAELEQDVTNAENNGGGWLAFSFHQICDTTTAGCDPIFSWSPEEFNEFAQWLAAQQSSGALQVETVQQVIGGAEQPAVTNYPVVAAAPVGTNALANPSLSDGLTVAGSPTTVPSTGGLITYSVNVTEGGATPTGSVIVSDGAGNSCTIASLTAGAGSCVIDEPAAETPYTVTATYSGDSTYTASEATLTGVTTETVGSSPPATNPPTSPECWSPESYGSNTPTFSWNPSGGVNGGGAETIDLSNVEGYPDEDANLDTTFDLGQCAPTATAGDSYELSVYYESSTPVYFNVFGQSTTDDTWSYWTGSPTFPAASTWTLATWLTPAVPSTIGALSYGMTIDNDGSLSTSDYGLVNEGGGPPPAGPIGSNVLANPLLETADGTGVNPACWSQAGFGTNTPTFTWSPTGGQVGGEDTIDMTSWTSGDAKLVTTFDNGNCAPTVTAGDTYTASVYYESTVPVYFTLYSRATDGTWGYWTQTPTFASASGWTLATFTTPPVPAGVNGASFGMSIASVGTLSTSDYSLVDDGTGPAVSTQPIAQSVTAGQNATFTAAATGNPSPTVQWQVSTDGGTTWSPVAGATSDTLTVTAAAPSQSGSEYEAVFTNPAGSATTAEASLTVVSIAQTITFVGPSSGAVGGTAALSATGGASGNPVVFSLDATSGAGVCALSGTNDAQVSYLVAGSCVIDANQAAGGDYGAAATVSQTVAVSQVAQTITFGTLANKTMAQSPVTVSATASSALPVTFTTSTSAVCTAGGTNGTTITLVSAGTCTVVANQAGNSTYAPAPAVSNSFTVSQVAQTITFAALANKTAAQSPVTVSASASSALPVTFTTSTATVCTAGGTNGTAITLLSAGTCTVVANQAGNTTYGPAPAVSQSFTVSQAAQTITFAAVANKTMAQSPVTVSATATSKLAVTFTTSTAAVCTAGGTNGATITLLSTGTCTVVANQAGNAAYTAAAAVSRSFTVSQAAQTITFAAVAKKTLAQSPVTVSATATSKLAVTFTTSTAAVCTAVTNGTTITLLSTGTCTVVANQAGNAEYAAAPSVTRSFTVT
jgi:peptidoglycan/xylan/chitin deacetylase (PgdA/CDA1 family)